MQSRGPQKIRCKEFDCDSDFAFGEREQDFFHKQGLDNPKRCKPCRQKKRERNEEKEREEESYDNI